MKGLSFDDLIKINQSLKEEIKCLEYDNELYLKTINKLKTHNDRLIKNYDELHNRHTQDTLDYFTMEKEYHRFITSNANGSRNWYRKRIKKIKNGQIKDSYISNIYQEEIKNKIIKLDKLSNKFMKKHNDRFLDKQIKILIELKNDLKDIEYKTGEKHIYSSFQTPMKNSVSEVETYINLDYGFALQILTLNEIEEETDNYCKYEKGECYQIMIKFCSINNEQII